MFVSMILSQLVTLVVCSQAVLLIIARRKKKKSLGHLYMLFCLWYAVGCSPSGAAGSIPVYDGPVPGPDGGYGDC